MKETTHVDFGFDMIMETQDILFIKEGLINISAWQVIEQAIFHEVFTTQTTSKEDAIDESQPESIEG
jgi:hypothetical protein